MVAVPRRDDPPSDSATDGLPEALNSALAEFCRHLSAERALSRHTVRAYQGDIQSLLEYAWRCGVGDPGSLDLATLRGWLASDPGPQLGTPKARRVLPQVLHRDEMNVVLADCEDRALREFAAGQRTAAALAARDAAVLELLYATAIRVSELCELDTGGLDIERRTVRVLGKGNKERVVPVGLPALRALSRWEEARWCLRVCSHWRRLLLPSLVVGFNHLGGSSLIV